MNTPFGFETVFTEQLTLQNIQEAHAFSEGLMQQSRMSRFE